MQNLVENAPTIVVIAAAGLAGWFIVGTFRRIHNRPNIDDDYRIEGREDLTTEVRRPVSHRRPIRVVAKVAPPRAIGRAQIVDAQVVESEPLAVRR